MKDLLFGMKEKKRGKDEAKKEPRRACLSPKPHQQGKKRSEEGFPEAALLPVQHFFPIHLIMVFIRTRLTLIGPFQYPRLQSPSLSAASNFPALSICDLAQWTGASRRRYQPRTCHASSALSESPGRAAESP